MAKLNNPKKPIYTREGGRAKRINPELQLRRSVMACMLWEKTFLRGWCKRCQKNRRDNP